MPSDPDQILASLLTVNDIREDNRECSKHRYSVPLFLYHSEVVYLEPKVTREVDVLSESTYQKKLTPCCFRCIQGTPYVL
jgi:hypothetical protein